MAEKFVIRWTTVHCLYGWNRRSAIQSSICVHSHTTPIHGDRISSFCNHLQKFSLCHWEFLVSATDTFRFECFEVWSFGLIIIIGGCFLGSVMGTLPNAGELDCGQCYSSFQTFYVEKSTEDAFVWIFRMLNDSHIQQEGKRIMFETDVSIPYHWRTTRLCSFWKQLSKLCKIFESKISPDWQSPDIIQNVCTPKITCSD